MKFERYINQYLEKIISRQTIELNSEIFVIKRPLGKKITIR